MAVRRPRIKAAPQFSQRKPGSAKARKPKEELQNAEGTKGVPTALASPLTPNSECSQSVDSNTGTDFESNANNPEKQGKEQADCSGDSTREEHGQPERRISLDVSGKKDNPRDQEMDSGVEEVTALIEPQQSLSLSLSLTGRSPVVSVNSPLPKENPPLSPKVPPLPSTSTSFKQPPKVEKLNHSATQHNVDGDVFYSDLEDKSPAPESPMSPSKQPHQQQRQRIRPMPVLLGQRRNSLVTGMSPCSYASEDFMAGSPSASSGEFALATARRERQYSSSSHTTASPHHRPFHAGMGGNGRMRTESNCSAFSDSYATSSKLMRTKNEDSTGAGGHSHKTAFRREFDARFANGVPEKSSLKMSDLIFYNPTTNPMNDENRTKIKREAPSPSLGTKVDPKSEIKTERSATSTPTNQQMLVPQLKLDANGEVILDDSSLEIETTADQEARKVLANSSLIYLDENTGSKGFYTRNKRTKDWPPEETIRFYRCLQTIGTDFSMMQQLFPNRNRRDLKLKFKKEERINPVLITKAILRPKMFNIEELKETLEQDDKEKAEAERQWQAIKAKKTKNVKKSKKSRSRGDGPLKDCDSIYENEGVTADKFSSKPSQKRQLQDGVDSPTEQETDGQNNQQNRKRRRGTQIKREIIELALQNEGGDHKQGIKQEISGRMNNGMDTEIEHEIEELLESKAEPKTSANQNEDSEAKGSRRQPNMPMKKKKPKKTQPPSSANESDTGDIVSAHSECEAQGTKTISVSTASDEQAQVTTVEALGSPEIPTIAPMQATEVESILPDNPSLNESGEAANEECAAEDSSNQIFTDLSTVPVDVAHSPIPMECLEVHSPNSTLLSGASPSSQLVTSIEAAEVLNEPSTSQEKEDANSPVVGTGTEPEASTPDLPVPSPSACVPTKLTRRASFMISSPAPCPQSWSFHKRRYSLSLPSAQTPTHPPDFILHNTDQHMHEELPPDFSEADVQDLLDRMSAGEVVMTASENDEGLEVYELFELDLATGELRDEPLDVPKAVLNMLLSVMS